MKVTYIRHAQIDRKRWDACITQSLNGIAYGYSWYLDIVCEGWDALIMDNYSAVMPLTHGRKVGINYLYQPFFTQQLGVFATVIPSASLVQTFLDAIPSKYKLIDIALNTYMNPKSIVGFKMDKRQTYQVDLVQSYPRLYQKYSKNTQRNLAKAIALGVSVVKGIDIATFLTFTHKHLKADLPDKAYPIMDKLVRQLVSEGKGLIMGAYSNTNELCAAALFVRTHGKSIYLLASSSEAGIENRGMFLLIDAYIQEHSEEPIVLDFEGSMIPGVAKFYSGFGAQPTGYAHIFRQKLPWVIQGVFALRRRLLH